MEAAATGCGILLPYGELYPLWKWGTRSFLCAWASPPRYFYGISSLIPSTGGPYVYLFVFKDGFYPGRRQLFFV